jgi:hypothetical protein
MTAPHLSADDILALCLDLGAAAFADGPAAGLALDVVRVRRTSLLGCAYTTASSRQVEALDEFEGMLFEFLEGPAKIIAEAQAASYATSEAA